MSLFKDLKRRNVIRVAVAYVVAAWLIIQVVETVFPAFGFGDAVVRIAVVVERSAPTGEEVDVGQRDDEHRGVRQRAVVADVRVARANGFTCGRRRQAPGHRPVAGGDFHSRPG